MVKVIDFRGQFGGFNNGSFGELKPSLRIIAKDIILYLTE